MFGFGKRKRYNGSVDIKLNNEYQIATNDNPQFPGILAYLKFIDNAWNAKMSEDEGALYIATLYYCGLRKHGLHDDADALYSRIDAIVNFGLPKGLISQTHWAAFSELILQANSEVKNEALVKKEQEVDRFDNKPKFEFTGGMPYFLKHQPRFKYETDGYEIFLFESLVSIAEEMTRNPMPIRFKYTMVLIHLISGEPYMIVTLEESSSQQGQFFLCAFESSGDHLNLGEGKDYLEISSFEKAALKFICNAFFINILSLKKYTY